MQRVHRFKSLIQPLYFQDKLKKSNIKMIENLNYNNIGGRGSGSGVVPDLDGILVSIFTC